jgi:methylenetetrahydrofolate dehydrogenase (NADP+)/methenyltetrahydrofolate cyclohydrolase
MGILINGKEIAKQIEESMAFEVAKLNKENKKQPTLAVILVGENPASQVYVRNKKKKAESLGINSFDILLDSQISQHELLEHISQLNNDNNIHGILLQLPLPKHLDTHEAIMSISSKKDVDGFHPENVGLLNIGKPRFVPCTPKGCIKLIKEVQINLSGMNALIIGRSNVVGWPLTKLLLNENCTVSVAHSHTKNLDILTKNSDIIIVAAGCSDLLKEDMIENNRSIIIDVGINRYVNETGENKIKGDVDFKNLFDKARAITPVPGGVGPMTIACLMENVLLAYKLQDSQNTN